MDDDSTVMSSSDSAAIEWLLNFGKQKPFIQESIETLIKYYRQCLLKLEEKTFDSFELNEATDYITDAQKYINNSYFRYNCLYFGDSVNGLGFLSPSFCDALLSLPNNLSNKEKIEYLKDKLNLSEKIISSVIIKIIRFYNMQLKLGHTARIVYIANEQIDFLKIDDELTQNAILTSALMHDVGRFYQALNYNTLNDSLIKREEKEIKGNGIDLAVDHAVAGYYYSLMDLYVLNSFGLARYDDLIIHSIAALTVRYHQLPNSLLKEFQSKFNDFSVSIDCKKNLTDFILQAFKNAPLLEKQQKKYGFDSQHILFIDQVLQKIVEEKKDVLISGFKKVSSSFELSENDIQLFLQRVEKSFSNSIANKDLLEKKINSLLKDREKSEYSFADLVKEIKEVVNSRYSIELINEQEIADIIEKIADYDIAFSIRNSFNNDSLNDDVRKVIGLALNSTMDADKLDILNQRAIGIYNSPYNPDSYSIYAVDTYSFCELLVKYFGFKFDFDELYFNENVFRVIEENIYPPLDNLFAKYGINLDELKKQAKISPILIKKGSFLYNYFVSLPWQSVLLKNGKRKADYKSVSEMPKIKVSSSIIDDNLKSSSFEEKERLYKTLIMVPEQITLFQSSANFPLQVQKLQDNYQDYDQRHIMWNPIIALLWQLNQFLFVNMRSRGSFVFIKENKMIEKIYDQYRENAILQAIIRPFLAYAMLFVDEILQTKNKNKSEFPILYDDEFMTNMRKRVYKIYKDDIAVLQAYEKKLDNNLNENISRRMS